MYVIRIQLTRDSSKTKGTYIFLRVIHMFKVSLVLCKLQICYYSFVIHINLNVFYEKQASDNTHTQENWAAAVLINLMSNQNCYFAVLKRQIGSMNVFELNDLFELSHVRVIAIQLNYPF